MRMMYQPAVKRMKPQNNNSELDEPISFENTELERTSDTEEHPRLAQPARRLVPVIQHLQHRTHLLPTVLRLIFDDSKLVLDGAVDFDDAVSRVRSVGSDDVEAEAVLVQDELVEGGRV